MNRKGSGRGKLILFGEHSAVYGYPAAGVSLPCRIILHHQATDRDSDSRTPGLSPPDIITPGETPGDRKIFLDLLGDLAGLKLSDGFRYEGTWTRKSDVPRTGGFGSSAALCVAISRIVLNMPGEHYYPEVHRLANSLERRFHGTPSGIDTGMAGDTGPALWTFPEGGLPDRKILSIPEWHIIYGALPRTAATAETVAALGGKMKSGNPVVIAAMKDLGALTESFSRLVEQEERNFPAEAAELVNRAQNILAGLDLSVPDLDRILAMALREGATGGKLSGGGAGGAFYLCAPDISTRNRLLEVLPALLEKEGIHLTVKLTPLDFPAVP